MRRWGERIYHVGSNFKNTCWWSTTHSEFIVTYVTLSHTIWQSGAMSGWISCLFRRQGEMCNWTCGRFCSDAVRSLHRLWCDHEKTGCRDLLMPTRAMMLPERLGFDPGDIQKLASLLGQNDSRYPWHIRHISKLDDLDAMLTMDVAWCQNLCVVCQGRSAATAEGAVCFGEAGRAKSSRSLFAYYLILLDLIRWKLEAK